MVTWYLPDETEVTGIELEDAPPTILFLFSPQQYCISLLLHHYPHTFINFVSIWTSLLLLTGPPCCASCLSPSGRHVWCCSSSGAGRAYELGKSIGIIKRINSKMILMIIVIVLGSIRIALTSHAYAKANSSPAVRRVNGQHHLLVQG